MTALHAADSVDSCKLPRIVSQLWLSHPLGGVVITIYNAIPSKNLRCQDALLEGAEARAYACGD